MTPAGSNTRQTNPTRVLERVVGAAVTIGDLVDAPVWSIPAETRTDDAAEALTARSFDHCVVSGDPVSSYLALADLRGQAGTVEDHARPILATDCVERSTPLSELFELLRERDFVFVLERDTVRYIVSRSDLGAPAVSMVVLAYLLALEQAIRNLFRLHQADPTELLTENRRGEAQRIFELRKERGVELSLDDCLQFGDWLRALSRNSVVRQQLGYHSRSEVDQAKRWLEVHRNNLAHGGSILDGGDDEAAIREVLTAIELAEMAWSQVDMMSGPWDAHAATIITGTWGVLAGPDAVDWPYRDSVGVVTAHNPGGAPRSEEMNRVANEQLRTYLQRRNIRPENALGSASDGSWAEEGVLIRCEREQLVEIGRVFGQLSVFEIDSQHLRVVRCADGEVVREVQRSWISGEGKGPDVERSSRQLVEGLRGVRRQEPGNR